MAESEKQRVVPSGKVYRQKFDAEVQLVKALETAEDRLKEREPAPALPHPPGFVAPIVRNAPEEGQQGILTTRQKAWAESFPNEPNVENPVLYKYYADDLLEQQAEPEGNALAREVRGLPDVLEPSNTGSDIIERISESRRLRHDVGLEEMHQELGIISSDLEPRIIEAGEELINSLAENDTEIEHIMARIAADEDLLTYEYPGLQKLWEEVADQSVQRQQLINTLDTTLASIEQERMQAVRLVFQAYAKTLEKIAHLMQPDLQRLLDKESQLINQTVLSNKRAYADLYARLMMSDIEREKRLHAQWKQRLQDWKALHIDKAATEFKAFMESDRILNPENANQVLNMMYTEQQLINKKRLELLVSLRDLKPPASTKTAIYQWNQQMTEITRQIDELNQTYFNKLYGEYEKVCQKCLEEVDRIKIDLLERDVCTEAQAKAIITDRCLPLVGTRQAAFEKELEEMDKVLEEHTARNVSELKIIFKYCQGVAHVWDAHELGLAKQERSMQERLEDMRRRHDNQNQDLEANLDIVMDRMRQDANEVNLKTSLTKSLDMLDKIKESYRKFHENQMKVVESYPEMVSAELARYDDTVCSFFSVSRRHPDDIPVDEYSYATIPPVEANRLRYQQRSPRHVVKRKKGPGSRTSSRASEEEEKPASPLMPMKVVGTLKSDNDTTFFMLAPDTGVEESKEEGQQEEKKAEEKPEQEAFLTETPPIEEKPEEEETKPYITNVDIPSTLIKEIKENVRMNFLNHLEDWAHQAEDRTKSVVVAKVEELNSELDLRLHLHQPRARRAELDVHNVRAAELVMHSERVSRHCKGMSQVLSDLKQRFTQMTTEHNRLADQFRTDIEAMETVFVNSTKSAKLLSLSSTLQEMTDKYMEVIRSSLRQFRQHLDETLQMLRESNARFIKSFKVFSDGGNFCPDEVEEYRKRLERMALKVDSSEGFIMADLEGMESKRLDHAMKVSHEFEDKFKHHLMDLLFMEKLGRWLTNTQVKVKAEVAESNSQAQTLARCLDDVERRIDACRYPNPDKESVSPGQLNESLRTIFEAFHERSHYLNCVDEAKKRPTSAAMQGNPALGARVGFVSTPENPSAPGQPASAQPTMPQAVQISKPGKQPSEDPSVSIIRNIMKTQKTRLRFGLDSTGEMGEDGERQAKEKDASNVNNNAPTTTDSQTKAKGKGSEKGSKGKGGNGSNTDQPKRAQSGTFRNSKSKGIDKKYFVFGEQPEEGELDHFLGKIRRVLREATEGLLAAAEMYYRQKGFRAVTRPQALQETFEGCADIVVAKLQSYYKQADEYHNQCLQELRGQLTRLEQLVADVPTCVIIQLMKSAIGDERKSRQKMNHEFGKYLKQWEEMKKSHEETLRPSLGHPQHAGELQALCDAEDTAQEEYMKRVNAHTKQLQDNAVSMGQAFINNLADCCEKLLLQYDDQLTVDDVEKGRIPPTKLPTAELLRRNNAGQPLEDDEDKHKLPRGTTTWPGVDKSGMSVADSEDSEEVIDTTKKGKKDQKKKPKTQTVTPSITTAQTSLGHTAAVAARDRAFQEYKRHFEASLVAIAEQRDQQLLTGQRWADSWNNSVRHVRSLFHT